MAGLFPDFHSIFLSLLIRHPGRCVADGLSALFISHEPAKPLFSTQRSTQQSPNPPEPTHDQSAFLIPLPRMPDQRLAI